MKTSFKTVSLLVFTVLWLALNDCIAQEQVLINRSSAINSTEILGLSKQLSSSPLASKFGGMYIETTGSTIGKPYVGYALNGASKAYHYYDGANNGWHLYNTGINMSLWPDSAKWVTTLGDEMTFEVDVTKIEGTDGDELTVDVDNIHLEGNPDDVKFNADGIAIQNGEEQKLEVTGVSEGEIHIGEIYTHGRSIRDIIIRITFLLEMHLLRVRIFVPNGNMDRSDYVLEQTLSTSTRDFHGEN